MADIDQRWVDEGPPLEPEGRVEVLAVADAATCRVYAASLCPSV